MKTKEEEIVKQWKIFVQSLPQRVNETPENVVADWWLEKIRQAIVEERLKTLKELIFEFQSNELEGKGYDFYFATRTKIDEILPHKNNYY